MNIQLREDGQPRSDLLPKTILINSCLFWEELAVALLQLTYLVTYIIFWNQKDCTNDIFVLELMAGKTMTRRY